MPEEWRRENSFLNQTKQLVLEAHRSRLICRSATSFIISVQYSAYVWLPLDTNQSAQNTFERCIVAMISVIHLTYLDPVLWLWLTGVRLLINSVHVNKSNFYLSLLKTPTVTRPCPNILPCSSVWHEWDTVGFDSCWKVKPSLTTVHLCVGIAPSLVGGILCSSHLRETKITRHPEFRFLNDDS